MQEKNPGKKYNNGPKYMKSPKNILLSYVNGISKLRESTLARIRSNRSI